MTDFFVCDDCETVDSVSATHQTRPGYHCHRCETGDWHHYFPEEKYDPAIHLQVLNRVNPDAPDGLNIGFS